jgi:hydroxyacylglutathione hydrolase
LPLERLRDAIEKGVLVDLRPPAEFAKGHVPGSINIPTKMLSPWAGWLVDYDKSVYLICQSQELEEAARVLHAIGCDNIGGGFDASAITGSGKADEAYTAGTPEDLVDAIKKQDVYLIDVRSQEEWDEGHIEQATHHFLGRLPNTAHQIPADAKVVTQCRSGARSAIAASVLQSLGHKNVVNLSGGYTAWKSSGLPSVKAKENATA